MIQAEYRRRWVEADAPGTMEQWCVDGAKLTHWDVSKDAPIERPISGADAAALAEVMEAERQKAVTQATERVRREVLSEKWDSEQKLKGWLYIAGTILFFLALMLFRGDCSHNP